MPLRSGSDSFAERQRQLFSLQTWSRSLPLSLPRYGDCLRGETLDQDRTIGIDALVLQSSWAVEYRVRTFTRAWHAQDVWNRLDETVRSLMRHGAGDQADPEDDRRPHAADRGQEEVGQEEAGQEEAGQEEEGEEAEEEGHEGCASSRVVRVAYQFSSPS